VNNPNAKRKKKNFVALIPMQKERKKNCGCNAKRKKKKFVAGDAVFFVSDVISEVVFGPFWLMLPGLGPNR